MKIAIGSDHRGFADKEWVKKNIRFDQGDLQETIEWIDVGTYTDERCDYPIYAKKVASLVKSGLADKGILFCGSGIGMAIVANRYKGVYAAIAWNEVVARFAIEHDKVNVLSIPTDFVSSKEAGNIIDAWLQGRFLEGHYKNRLDMIDKINDVL